ncbi:MAG: hypothetical protein ACLFP2_05530 [Candidatus Woesearchaeota archaeon]
MSKKEQCKAIMGRLFGEASAAQVDNMAEENCVEQCKRKVTDFLGSSIADKEFSGL